MCWADAWLKKTLVYIGAGPSAWEEPCTAVACEAALRVHARGIVRAPAIVHEEALVHVAAGETVARVASWTGARVRAENIGANSDKRVTVVQVGNALIEVRACETASDIAFLTETEVASRNVIARSKRIAFVGVHEAFVDVLRACGA